MSAEEILGGMWADREGNIDATGNIQAFASAAKGKRTEIAQHKRVFELNQTLGRWEVIAGKDTVSFEYMSPAEGLRAKQEG